MILLTFFQARLGDDICGVEDIGEEEEGRGVPQPLDMSSKCHHVRSRRIKTGFLIRTHKIDSENSSERSDISDTDLALTTDTAAPLSSALQYRFSGKVSELLLALISAETDIFLLKCQHLWLTPHQDLSSHRRRGLADISGSGLSAVPSPQLKVDRN